MRDNKHGAAGHVSGVKSGRLSGWKGAASELVTPFDVEGHVMLDLVSQEIEFMASVGISGVMVNGFASEVLLMNDEDRMAAARTAKESAPLDFPIMGTVLAGSVVEGVRWVRGYEKIGLDCIAIGTPPLYPYGVDALVDYYIQIAASTELPVYVYNSPEWGNKLPPEAVARIIDVSPNVVGLKDATHSLIELQSLYEMIGKERVSVLSGSDALTVPMMLVGAQGVISLVTVVFPELIVSLCQAAARGDWSEAMALQSKVMRVRSALKIGPFMAAYKHVGNLTGHPLGTSRAPLRALTSEEAKAVEAGLDAEGML